MVRYKHITAPPSDEQVRRWVEQGIEPDAYWLRCGQCSGVIVFDFDISPLKDIGYEKSYIQIVSALSIFAELYKACEPYLVETRRGIHYYLRCYDIVRTRNLGEYYIGEDGEETDNIEDAHYKVEVHLRGEGAGVIVPPSPDKRWLCGNMEDLVRTQPPQGIIDALKRYDASQQVLPLKDAGQRGKEQRLPQQERPSRERRVKLPKGHGKFACIKGIITAILDGRDCYRYHERDLVLFTLYNQILRTGRNTPQFAQDFVCRINQLFSQPLPQKELDKVFHKEYHNFGCEGVLRNVPWAKNFCGRCPMRLKRHADLIGCIPPDIIPKLSLLASKVLWVIDLYGDLSNAQLAREAGVSRQAVIKARKELKQFGLLQDTA
jgi:hypothetical protein